jgi:hypothetical protein
MCIFGTVLSYCKPWIYKRYSGKRNSLLQCFGVIRCRLCIGGERRRIGRKAGCCIGMGEAGGRRLSPASNAPRLSCGRLRGSWSAGGVCRGLGHGLPARRRAAAGRVGVSGGCASSSGPDSVAPAREPSRRAGLDLLSLGGASHARKPRVPSRGAGLTELCTTAPLGELGICWLELSGCRRRMATGSRPHRLLRRG